MKIKSKEHRKRDWKYKICYQMLTVVLMTASFIGSGVAQTESIPQRLDLETALSRTLQNHPKLLALEKEFEAKKSKELQAKLKPNPVLEFGLENVLGNGPQKGFDGAEATIAVSQTIERGEKQKHRVDLVRRETNLLMWDKEDLVLSLKTKVKEDFINVLGLQEELNLNLEAESLTRSLLTAVKAKVDAGDSPSTYVLRVQIALEKVLLQKENLRVKITSANQNLYANWGDSATSMGTLTGNLKNIPKLPNWDDLLQALKYYPNLAKIKSETLYRESTLALEQSLSYKDVDVFAGVKHFQDSSSQAMLLGFSIELPFRNRNQGSIGEAKFMTEQMPYMEGGLLRDLTSELKSAYDFEQRLINSLKTLDENILPSAQALHHSLTESYQLGKLTFLELLDIKNELLELEQQKLDLVIQIQKGYISIEKLTNSISTKL